MNDKQQLAAMGAELRLTEEQAKAMAERMPQTGTLQILDDEPLCTEIRINGVEACGADIGGLLDRCLPHTTEQQPLCMAKRIEELEAQVRVMAGLLRDAHPCVSYMINRIGPGDVLAHLNLIYERIDDALDGNMPNHAEQTLAMVPEGWQLVPHMPTPDMCAAFHRADSDWEDGWAFDDNGNRHYSPVYQWVAMLAASPKPEAK